MVSLAQADLIGNKMKLRTNTPMHQRTNRYGFQFHGSSSRLCSRHSNSLRALKHNEVSSTHLDYLQAV